MRWSAGRQGGGYDRSPDDGGGSGATGGPDAASSNDDGSCADEGVVSGCAAET